jgi:uncharacterized protein (DUF305 family)
MHEYLALAALLIASPIAAQTLQPTDHSTMSGMNHDPATKPAGNMPMMERGKMRGPSMMGTANMGMGAMMENTPANPYAEAGMAMHHKMMVVGANASETWVRQMIEHHRGAVAMSKIAVVEAMDSDIRAMAKNDIAMQVKEIAGLQSWLKRHEKMPQ